MIKNILFDMGGVVFRQDTREALRRFAAAGIDTTLYMGDYGQKDFFLDIETGAIDTHEFCRRMAAAAGRQEVTHDEALYCWLGFVHDVPIERLHHLLTLKTQHHVCLLSNTNPFVMSYMESDRFSSEGMPISHYFHSLFCSYRMGICKPHRQIFERALKTDGMLPRETLFVDDSEANVQAARALGIQGLHVPTNEDWWEEVTRALHLHDRQ